jgi:hypothetical protein
MPPSYVLHFHFNIILPSPPGSLKWLPSLRSPHQNPVCTSLYSHTCYMPRPSPSSRLRLQIKIKLKLFISQGNQLHVSAKIYSHDQAYYENNKKTFTAAFLLLVFVISLMMAIYFSRNMHLFSFRNKQLCPD